MKEKAKLKLEDIEVESFLTSLDSNKIMGGASADEDVCTPETNATCEGVTCNLDTCAYSCGGTCPLTGEYCVNC